MSLYPKGSYIKMNDTRRKVIEELGDIRFVSQTAEDTDDWETELGFVYTSQHLARMGYVEESKPEEPWTPKYEEKYWLIDRAGEPDYSFWENDEFDNLCRDFLGIFPTKELAEKRAEEIKKLLKK